jgi:flagellar secretion chaperone FliS
MPDDTASAPGERMPAANAYAAYRSAEVTTMSQRDLLVKLYQGAERFLVQARAALANQQWEMADTGCQKAKRIFMELMATLNFSADATIAGQLRDLYLFIVAEIVQANLRHDGERLHRLLPIIATLREGWEQVPAEFAEVSSLPPEARGSHLNFRF